MNELVAKIGTLPPEILGLVRQIAPELAALPEAQREQIFKSAAYRKITRTAEKVLNIYGVDWVGEREEFLNSFQSEHTRRSYAGALNRFENWAGREGINPSAASYAEMNSYVTFMKSENRAPASIRRDVAGLSSLFTFLERRHEGIKNTVRGTRLRPKSEPKKAPRVPTADEVKIILEYANPELKAAISVMAFRGLRCGALPGLSAWGGQFETKSKGQVIRGRLPEEAMRAIESAGLSLKKPFEGMITNNFEKRLEYYVKGLYRRGLLSRLDSEGRPIVFGCHSFRHYYAVTEYQKNKDIHALRVLLNHSDIGVTDKYLRGLQDPV